MAQIQQFRSDVLVTLPGGRLAGMLAIALAATVVPFTARAAIPDSAAAAVVRVVCDDRQGSGAVVARETGYVLSSGHVALDDVDRSPAERCFVEFPATAARERSWYRADIVRAVFDIRTSRDFALLRLGERLSGPERPAVDLRVNEYAWVGDAVTAFGFPEGAMTAQTATGRISRFVRGTMETDAPIAQGYSGGPVLDFSGNLVGVATRIAFTTDDATGAERPTEYEMGDVLSLINWLDEIAPEGHDAFLRHVDADRYHQAAYQIRDESSPCSYVVFVPGSTALSCLMAAGERLVFPDESTYRTWYPDFSSVLRATSEQLSEYRPVGNVTMRPGGLVKIQTDPKVYLVADSFGTLRHVPSEERARELFGAGWATLVKDVPDAFFADYRVGQPLR